MHDLRSTFPLDEPAIIRAALGRVVTDPVTWAPFVPVVAAYSIFDVPGLVVAGVGGGVAAGLGIFWGRQWSSLTAEVRGRMIAEHNRAQNALLSTACAELRLAGAAADAEQLSAFVELKRQIEGRLHEEGGISGQKIQLEQLVDSLCFGVRDQLCALAQPAQRRLPRKRMEVLSQVATAYETLQTTLAELENIIGPDRAPAGLTHDSLAEITRRLHEEAEIARRVQARLHQPEVAPVSLPLSE